MKHLFAAMLLASWSLIGPPEHLYVTKQATGQQIWMGLQAPLSAWTHYQPTIRRKNALQAGSLTLGMRPGDAAQLAEADQLRPVVDPRHFTLDTVQEAHEAVEKGTAAVKIVIDVAAQLDRWLLGRVEGRKG